jgi:uncharacterized protein
MPSSSAPSRSTVRAEPASISVEVAYSPRAGEVDLVRLTLAAGSTALQALHASGLLERHPQIDATASRLGIWGRGCLSGAPLRDGDRVELYRELRVDPKEARRERYRGQRARQRR